MNPVTPVANKDGRVYSQRVWVDAVAKLKKKFKPKLVPGALVAEGVMLSEDLGNGLYKVSMDLAKGPDASAAVVLNENAEVVPKSGAFMKKYGKTVFGDYAAKVKSMYAHMGLAMEKLKKQQVGEATLKRYGVQRVG
jgi:hypothetical protein